MNGSMSDISPRELIDIWWALGDSHIVCPHDAAESDNKAEEGEGSTLEAVVSLLSSV